jgi:hypothetical protein
MLSVPVCGRTEDFGAVNSLGNSADCLRGEKDRERTTVREANLACMLTGEVGG